MPIISVHSLAVEIIGMICPKVIYFLILMKMVFKLLVELSTWTSGSYGGPVRVDNNGGQTCLPTQMQLHKFLVLYNSTDNWRTLLRGLANDHPVLIQSEQIILDIMKMVARILLILGLM